MSGSEEPEAADNHQPSESVAAEPVAAPATPPPQPEPAAGTDPLEPVAAAVPGAAEEVPTKAVTIQPSEDSKSAEEPLAAAVEGDPAAAVATTEVEGDSAAAAVEGAAPPADGAPVEGEEPPAERVVVFDENGEPVPEQSDEPDVLGELKVEPPEPTFEHGIPLRLAELPSKLISLEAPSEILAELNNSSLAIPAHRKSSVGGNLKMSGDTPLVAPVEKKYYISQHTLYKLNCEKLGIKMNSSVKKLMLDTTEQVKISEYNFEKIFLGDKGLLSLITPLELNRNFSTLRLRGNGIHNLGLIKLVDMLIDHAPLTRLDVSDNFISKDGVKALLRLVKSNKNLVELDFHNTFNVDIPMYKEIRSIVDHNQTTWKEMLGINNKSNANLLRQKNSRRATLDSVRR